MSKTVATAANAVRTKALAPAKVLHKKEHNDKPSHDDTQPAQDDSSTQQMTTHHDNADTSATSMAGSDYSFAAALASAEASQAIVSGGLVGSDGATSMLADSDSDAGGGGHHHDSTPILIGVGVAAAVGAGVAIGTSGGHHKNAPPTFSSGTATLAATEDTAAKFTPSATDTDTLTYSVSTNPGHGTTTVAGGVVTYTPAANYNGSDSFVVTATDTKGQTATQTVNVTVAPVNDAPVVAATQAVHGTEDTAHAFTVTATDVENDPLTFSVSTAPTHGTITGGANGAFTYTPAADFNGTDTAIIQVDDGHGGKSTETVTFTIDPVNDAPVVAPTQAVNAHTGAATPVTVAATDVDGDTLAYSVTTSPTHGVVVSNGNGTFSYTSAAGFVGADSFVVKVDDGHGGVANETVNLTVAIPTAAVTINAAGTDTDSANVNTTYTVQLGNYTHTIAGFGAGDHLAYPAGAPVALNNSDFSDGMVTLQYAQAGQVSNVVLTGLTAAQDAQLFGPNDLNTVFGAGTIA